MNKPANGHPALHLVGQEPQPAPSPVLAVIVHDPATGSVAIMPQRPIGKKDLAKLLIALAAGAVDNIEESRIVTAPGPLAPTG